MVQHAARVGVNEPLPTHHVKLSRDGTEVNLILCDNRGLPDERGLERQPYPNTAIRTYTGEDTYGDEEPPFRTIAQDDFAGGRGLLAADEDQTRYFDGWRIDTTRSERVLLGPQEQYAAGIRGSKENLPGNMTWHKLYGAGRFLAATLTMTADLTADRAELWIRKVGAPAALTLQLMTSAGGEPAVELKAVTLASITDVLSRLYSFNWTGTQALTNGATYHLVISGAATDDNANHWEVGVGGAAGLQSADGVTWAAAALEPYYRVLDADSPFAGLFFEYQRALYMVKRFDSGGHSTLWLNGDRGAADSNAGQLTKLIDGTKTWTANEWAGAVVIITRGPGAQDNVPWRDITGNDATSLTVSEAWNIEHTTDTEYVIVGSNKWTQILSLGAPVGDVAVADDYVYFARDGLRLLRYQEYNKGGVWTTRSATERVAEASRLLAIREATAGTVLWGAEREHEYYGNSVWRAQVPLHWGDLYRSAGMLLEAGSPWDKRTVANVVQDSNGVATIIKIADAFGTGVAAVVDLALPADVSNGQRLSLPIYSTVAVNAGDLQLQYSDITDLGGSPVSKDLPALEANTWTWVELDYTPVTVTETKILSLALNVVVDNGAQDIYIGNIEILLDILEHFGLPDDAGVNTLIAYAGGEDQRENPWIITENQVYEVQTQNSNAVVPLALGEMKAVRSETNGQGACVNGVYLYFNMGEKVQRYYNRSLDDVGPDRDEGLPADRHGVPRTLLSYPGRVYAGLDGETSRTSSILVNRGSGWHEVYRAPRTRERIRGMLAQSVPNGNIDRLWFAQGGDVLWLPVSLNPEQNSNYLYTHEAVLETARYYGGRRDIAKYWNAVKIASASLSSSRFIRVDYRTDQNNAWVEVADIFDESPFQEVEFSSGNDVSGRWIQLRVRLYTLDASYTPSLEALVLESVMRVPIKHVYPLQFRLGERDLDLTGELDPVSGIAKLAQLDAWINSILPLTLNSISPLSDGKLVYPEPGGVQLVDRVQDDQGREVWIARMNLISL